MEIAEREPPAMGPVAEPGAVGPTGTPGRCAPALVCGSVLTLLGAAVLALGVLVRVWDVGDYPGIGVAFIVLGGCAAAAGLASLLVGVSRAAVALDHLVRRG